MNEITKKWKNKYGIVFLKEIGAKDGDKVLDCCCGEGNYTVPLAKIVGKDGLVYALEMNEKKLKILENECISENLKNIKIIQAEFKTSLPLTDKSLDLVLLYDIFLYFTFEDTRLYKLLEEVYRISKDNVIVSVYPEHVNRQLLRQKIEKSGFTLEKNFLKTLVHDDKFKKGHIINFRKVLK